MEVRHDRAQESWRNWKRCARPGLLVWKILDALEEDGRRKALSTYDLEVAAEKMMADAGARPAFKGYSTPGGGNEVSLCAVHFGE